MQTCGSDGVGEMEAGYQARINTRFYFFIANTIIFLIHINLIVDLF